MRHIRAFTLYELLLVIGIVAVLATTTVLVFNPAEYSKQSRDSARIADITNLQAFLADAKYSSKRITLGTAKTVYISIPDSDSGCANLTLPELAVGWSYRCVTSVNLRNVDGTGWLPVNVTSLNTMHSLPVDPVNNETYFYSFIAETGNEYSLVATLESSKRKLEVAAGDGGGSEDHFEMGSDLTLWADAYTGEPAPTPTPTPTPPSHSPSWLASEYGKRIKITFDTTGTASTSNLTDFPLSVQLNSSRISYTDTQDSGQDIRFTDSDGTTLLNYEIEQWNESGTSTVWVKVPQVAMNSSTDHVWMYYKNASATDNSTTTGVWDSNYVGVWHFNESSGTRNDSTSKGHHLSDNDTVAGVAGFLAGAADFEATGVSEYLNRADASLSSDFPGKNGQPVGSFTVSYWVKPESMGQFDWLGKRSNTSNGWWFYDSASLGMIFQYTNGSNYSASTGNGLFSLGAWSYVTTNHDATNDVDYVYFNGQRKQSATSRTTDPLANAGTFMVGGTDPYPGEADGVLDEVRVSKASRSYDWILFEYCNQSNGCTTYGSPETY